MHIIFITASVFSRSSPIMVVEVGAKVYATLFDPEGVVCHTLRSPELAIACAYKQLQCATYWLSTMFTNLHSFLVAYFVKIIVLNHCKTGCFSRFFGSF